MARFPQIGNSSPYTKKIYINLKQNANKQGKKVHTLKKTYKQKQKNKKIPKKQQV